jgi:hypothetical protein
VRAAGTLPGRAHTSCTPASMGPLASQRTRYGEAASVAPFGADAKGGTAGGVSAAHRVCPGGYTVGVPKSQSPKVPESAEVPSPQSPVPSPPSPQSYPDTAFRADEQQRVPGAAPVEDLEAHGCIDRDEADLVRRRIRPCDGLCGCHDEGDRRTGQALSDILQLFSEATRRAIPNAAILLLVVLRSGARQTAEAHALDAWFGRSG